VLLKKKQSKIYVRELAFAILKLLFSFSIKFNKSKNLAQGWLYKINWFKEKQRFMFALNDVFMRFKSKSKGKKFKSKVRRAIKVNAKIWRRLLSSRKYKFTNVTFFLRYGVKSILNKSNKNIVKKSIKVQEKVILIRQRLFFLKKRIKKSRRKLKLSLLSPYKPYKPEIKKSSHC